MLLERNFVGLIFGNGSWGKLNVYVWFVVVLIMKDWFVKFYLFSSCVLWMLCFCKSWIEVFFILDRKDK